MKFHMDWKLQIKLGLIVGLYLSHIDLIYLTLLNCYFRNLNDSTAILGT